MHLDYTVNLSDHDFPVGEKHKLIPYIYASCEKNKDGSIGYNGPTYIAILSEERDKSSAASHIEDFRTLLFFDEFKEKCLKDGVLEPILLVSVAGGPDDAPKCTMTLDAWATIFKEYDLGIALIFTYTRGRD